MVLFARRRGRIEAGSRSNELVVLTDMTATPAELMARKLPAGVGPDSFSFVGTLVTSKQSCTIRTSLVHNSYGGGFGIRNRDWKLLIIQRGAGRLVGHRYGVHG